MTTEITLGTAAFDRRVNARGRPAARAVVLLLLCATVGACGLKPERRIDDPDCEYCYRLPSGVKYKTYQYYAP